MNNYVGKYLIDTYHEKRMGEVNIIYKIIDYAITTPSGFVGFTCPCIRMQEVDTNLINPNCCNQWIRVSLIGVLYNFIDYQPKPKQLSLFNLEEL